MFALLPQNARLLLFEPAAASTLTASIAAEQIHAFAARTNAAAVAINATLIHIFTRVTVGGQFITRVALKFAMIMGATFDPPFYFIRTICLNANVSFVRNWLEVNVYFVD